MKRYLTFILLCSSFTASLLAQGTGFFYQGRLNENGGAASGLYQMQFTVFDSNVGSGLVAGPQLATNVVVTNGAFTVYLDFGPNVFTGPPRWLEIDVRAYGSAEFTKLNPRQPVLPTPYAMHAASVSALAPGTVTAGQLSVAGPAPADGQVLGFDGTSLIWRNSATGGGDSVWSLQDTNVYYTGGDVGVGTSTPQTKLDVRGVLTLDTGANAGIVTGRGFTELNRYLALFNSMEYTSASGLKAGGILCSDSYDYANPGKNDLVVKGQISYGAQLNKLDVADNFYSVIRAADLMLGHSSRRGSPGRALVDLGDRLVVNFANDWAAATVIGGAITEVRALRITGGADIAEPFPMDNGIEKGSVVVIDHENAGRLKRSTQAYDKRVAGIVSGANGIKAGLALHQEGVLDQGENVALSGRVYVLADASNTSIEPGDLLTTSDTPGHAMKVTDHARAQGAILGKAMSSLTEGKGMVLVLVTLQ